MKVNSMQLNGSVGHARVETTEWRTALVYKYDNRKNRNGIIGRSADSRIREQQVSMQRTSAGSPPSTTLTLAGNSVLGALRPS
jgi:hypothetical protein